MDLSTRFMGLDLKNPVIIGSSNLANTADKIKKCEDAGAAAVVLKSLFEEQIIQDAEDIAKTSASNLLYPEALDYISNYTKGKDIHDYISLIEDSKKAVGIPVIASINCMTAEEWPVFSKNVQEAGADALELNIYILPSDKNLTAEKINSTYFEIIKEVKKNITIPCAVKLGHYFTDLSAMISALDDLQVNGLVLFNRYLRPDIDIENMSIIHGNGLSTPEELGISLRWVALMSEKVQCDLCGATGIHDGSAIIKQVLAGAKAVQICSALLKNGLDHIGTMLKEMEAWMERHNFSGVEAFRGQISGSEENGAHFERVQFLKRTVEAD